MPSANTSVFGSARTYAPTPHQQAKGQPLSNSRFGLFIPCKPCSLTHHEHKREHPMNQPDLNQPDRGVLADAIPDRRDALGGDRHRVIATVGCDCFERGLGCLYGHDSTGRIKRNSINADLHIGRSLTTWDHG